MAYAKKSSSGGGISTIVKQAGAEARRNALANSLPLSVQGKGQTSAQAARIFNILDYIEQPWGLAMRLFPAQRFIVKLAYFLPLNEVDKTITITDMYNYKGRVF